MLICFFFVNYKLVARVRSKCTQLGISESWVICRLFILIKEKWVETLAIINVILSEKWTIKLAEKKIYPPLIEQQLSATRKCKTDVDARSLRGESRIQPPPRRDNSECKSWFGSHEGQVLLVLSSALLDLGESKSRQYAEKRRMVKIGISRRADIR